MPKREAGPSAFARRQGECRVVREASQGSSVMCLLSLKGAGVIEAERREGPAGLGRWTGKWARGTAGQ